VHGGAASLSGVVGSLAQRDAAAGDAMRGGATSVDTAALRIDWRESTRGRAMALQPLPADGRISTAVKRALADDARVGVDAPGVSVEGGVVTLSGKVDDFRAARAAVRDARLVSGVSRVDDEVTVEPAKSQSDGTIQKQVLAGIYSDVAAAGSQDIRVTTTMAKVTLQGTVATLRDKAVIEDDVEEVPGVVAVNDDLHVRGNDAFITPSTLQRGVSERIFWDPRIASPDSVAVDVSESTVTLTGRVDSWQAARAAGDDAVTAGAADVVNRLQVAVDLPVPRVARR
jgi:osmotically-inducible protein OsmY